MGTKERDSGAGSAGRCMWSPLHVLSEMLLKAAQRKLVLGSTVGCDRGEWLWALACGPVRFLLGPCRAARHGRAQEAWFGMTIPHPLSGTSLLDYLQ